MDPAAFSAEIVLTTTADSVLQLFIFSAGTANGCETQGMILHGLLAKYFGVTTLHQWELRTILSTLDGRDGLVIQPTGSGKSICFYFPPHLSPERQPW